MNKRNYGSYSIEYNGDYYLEIKPPTLFNKGSVALYKYAHPNSMSPNHLIERGDYEELEDFKWELLRYTDPICTIYGDF